MKKQLLFTLLVLFMGSSLKVGAQDHTGAFITLWDTQYMTASTKLTIPCLGTNYQYYWEKVGEEGTVNSGAYQTQASNNLVTTIDDNTGQYRVYIKNGSGSYSRILMTSDASSAKALIAIESWGNIAWTSMQLAFHQCANLTVIPVTAPNLSNLTNMGSMFYGAVNFNADISSWDVSKVTTMASMFRNTAFNQNIGNWDVSSVTTMVYMFEGAIAFNQNIGTWNVSNVTTMGYMFNKATAFNQDISSWNVGNKVTNMGSMFRDATAFNQNIGNWDVSKVTSMTYMFYGAGAFDQNIGNWQLNANVDMTSMLSNSGLSSLNYGLTLKGWAENSSTPSSRSLGATGLKYKTADKQYRDVLTDTKTWTITGDSEETLPVGLISFTAKVEGNAAKLTWATASEYNNDKFMVYRSGDDKQFAPIGELKGKNTASDYVLYDRQPLNGNNYYQLVQLDNDGSRTDLGTRLVSFGLSGLNVQLYPNPVSKQLNIGVLQTGKVFYIYNTQGQQVAQQQLGRQQSVIDVSAFAPGLYVYQYGNEKGKFIKTQ